MRIREPAVAGTFYPEEPASLQRLVKEYLEEAKPPKVSGSLRALILPHAGYIFSGPVAATGFKLLQVQPAHLRGGRPARRLVRRSSKSEGGSLGAGGRDSSEVKVDERINRVVILGPNHFYSTARASTAPYQFWQTPLGRVEVDQLAFDLVKEEKLESSILAHQGEHSIEVMLPFLQVVLNLPAGRQENFSIVPILTGEENPQKLAAILLPHLSEKTLLIASSDLSHFLPYEEAQIIDKKTCQLVEKLELEKFLEEGDAPLRRDFAGRACGNLAIATLMLIAKEKNWRLQLLDYRNSGDTAGQKSQVVGYGSFACVA